MTVLQDTLPGSYDGIPFLMMMDNVVGGRKTVVHQYPNSDAQKVEDLGLRPRVYSETIIIQSDANGENYLSRRDGFLRVLESGGGKVLVHPLFGRISRMALLSFSLEQDFKRLGEARFNVTWTVDGIEGVPTTAGDSLTLIVNSAEAALSAVQNDMGGTFEVSNIFPVNFTAAVEKVNDAITAFEDNASFLTVEADNINAFSFQVGELSQNVVGLVSQPTQLAESITSLFNTTNGLYASVDATFEVIQKFFSFGSADQDTPLQLNTAGRIERAQNQNLLNYTIRAQALILNYSNAAQIDYATVDDVDRVASILEEQYQDVFANSIFTTETISTLTTLRTDVQAFFDAQKLSLSHVVTVVTNILPMRAIGFQYYGDDKKGEQLVALNGNINVSFINGSVDVLSS